MSKIEWPKKAIDWIEGKTAFVSVPFTWELPQAYSRCVFLRKQGYSVRVGGPAVSLMPDYLAGVAEIGGEIDALKHHNPNAVFTSRGCIRKRGFCAVPKIEPDFVELPRWEAKPIICDNNLLACSTKHFDRVVDSLKGLKSIDFNQGLDVRLLTNYHASRLGELDLMMARLAWDWTPLETQVIDALNRLLIAGIPKGKIRVYVLIGYNDTPEDALYRLETLKMMQIRPSPQRYNPLNALVKDNFLPPKKTGWTKRLLHKFMRYWSKQIWLEHVPFEEFDETR